MEYKTENYAICWDCHNKDMALTEVTSTLTGFRNGSRNLHFFHINQKKGRSCKACHERRGAVVGRLLERLAHAFLGERVLGLPGDVRVDKDVAWNTVPRS